mmetsp:Transcript_177385/g.568795  ORF Transcript_177385/g.568795 Transcript_177385/m.568795 type:complete len:454 (+) Transcript_177385:3246-4607(+)
MPHGTLPKGSDEALQSPAAVRGFENASLARGVSIPELGLAIEARPLELHREVRRQAVLHCEEPQLLPGLERGAPRQGAELGRQPQHGLPMCSPDAGPSAQAAPQRALRVHAPSVQQLDALHSAAQALQVRVVPDAKCTRTSALGDARQASRQQLRPQARVREPGGGGPAEGGKRGGRSAVELALDAGGDGLGGPSALYAERRHVAQPLVRALTHRSAQLLQHSNPAREVQDAAQLLQALLRKGARSFKLLLRLAPRPPRLQAQAKTVTRRIPRQAQQQALHLGQVPQLAKRELTRTPLAGHQQNFPPLGDLARVHRVHRRLRRRRGEQPRLLQARALAAAPAQALPGGGAGSRRLKLPGRCTNACQQAAQGKSPHVQGAAMPALDARRTAGSALQLPGRAILAGRPPPAAPRAAPGALLLLRLGLPRAAQEQGRREGRRRAEQQAARLQRRIL